MYGPGPIPTSTSRTSVALIADNQVLWSEFEDGVNAHAEAVPRLVQRALLINNEISRSESKSRSSKKSDALPESNSR